MYQRREVLRRKFYEPPINIKMAQSYENESLVVFMTKFCADFIVESGEASIYKNIYT